MASIELSPLSTRLEPNEIRDLEQALADAGSSPLDIDPEGETQLLDRDVDDDLLAELFDRLDVNDAACDVYVPPDFEHVIDVGDWKIGSAHTLLLALQELAEELGVDDDDDGDGGFDDDDLDADEEFSDAPMVVEDDAYALRDGQLNAICQTLQRGAQMCIRRGVAMFVQD
jgi:hypothetical protein